MKTPHSIFASVAVLALCACSSNDGSGGVTETESSDLHGRPSHYRGWEHGGWGGGGQEGGGTDAGSRGNDAGGAAGDAATETDAGTRAAADAGSPGSPGEGGSGGIGSTGAGDPGCTKTLAAGGDLASFILTLRPGDVACLASGATYATDLSFRSGTSGTASAAITITSADRSHPATIKGRMATFPGANYLTFSYLNLDGINSTNLPSPTVGSDYVTFTHDDITDEHTAICVNTIDDPTYGTAHATLIDSCRIHDCGVLPATNGNHGLYLIGYDAVVTNNYIYGNADRGVQLRGSQGARVQYNVIDGNGEGVIFGDLTANDNVVSYNVISNSNVRFNAEDYWGSEAAGSGNTLENNCLFTTVTGYYGANGGVMPGLTGVTAANNTIADPRYADAAAHDYSLGAGSPCAGMGPQ